LIRGHREFFSSFTVKQEPIIKYIKPFNCDIDNEDVNKILHALKVDIRGGLEEIFDKYSEDGKMSLNQFKEFMANEQSETINEDLNILIPRYALQEEDMTIPHFSIFGFQNFIAANDIMNQNIQLLMRMIWFTL